MSGKVTVVEGDITRIPVDAIVNAANQELLPGGGVCGAIFRAAGQARLGEACARIGECATGSAVVTPAFGIKTAKYIVHAVGPVYVESDEAEARRLLRSTYASAIARAVEMGCKSIAFPAISTGIYGYPIGEACREAVAVCVSEASRTGLDIVLVAFNAEMAGRLTEALRGASRPAGS